MAVTRPSTYNVLTGATLRRAQASGQSYDIRIANGRFIIKTKIGAGSFGEIYRAVDTARNNDLVAVKLELAASPQAQLPYESKMYRSVTGGSYCIVGIPEVHFAGIEGDYNVIVIALLGPNLEDLFNYCQRRFSMKTVCLLGEQMLYRMEHIHLRGVIHRDQKPENWAMGIGDSAQCVYLIDFGLSKKYFDSKRNAHIPFRDGKSLTGTARYCSANAHRGYEQSRRDDLQSMAYVLTYFLNSSLPWQKITGAADPAERTVLIGEKKMATHASDLAAGHPVEFLDFLNLCWSLEFEDTPDYKRMRSLFRNMLSHMAEPRDFVFDWLLKRDLEKLAGTTTEIQPSQPNDTTSLASVAVRVGSTCDTAAEHPQHDK